MSPERNPSLQVAGVVETLHEIARAEGSGYQGRKLNLLVGLLALSTPLEARYLLRLVTGNLRLGIGTPTILDALAQVYAGGRKNRAVLERGTTSAAISAWSPPRWPPMGWPELRG